MKIAVVGATGFVGSAVCGELRSQGHDVTAVPTPRVAATQYKPEDHVQVVAELVREFEGHVAVVNCAGVPDASSQDHALLFGANAVVAGLVARAVSRLGESCRLVHVSSAAVQGRMPVLDDSTRTDAFSPYARSKAAGERLVAEELCEGLVIYRPPSVHAVGRRVTRAISRIAASPLRSVAGPGARPSPQALLGNVASAVAYLATCSRKPPSVVIHPWEGVTTSSLMRSLGGRSPHVVPEQVARAAVRLMSGIGRVMPSLAPTARRVEMLWFGQGQDESWLTRDGWTPPVGPAGWVHLAHGALSAPASGGSEAREPDNGTTAAVPGAALVSTTIPMTLRHFYRELVGIMLRDGYDVTLVSSSGPHLDAAVVETGARAHVIEMSRDVTPLRDLRAWVDWFRLTRARQPAVVVAGTPKAALLGMTAAAVCRVPRRVYLCGGLRLEGSTCLLRYMLIWMERLAMGAATEVMVNSSTLKAEVLSGRLVSPDKLRQTVPGSTHGVDTHRFAPREPERSLLDQHGIAPGTPVLGFVGRLTHDKGIDTLIHAASVLAQSDVRFHLLLVGPQNEPDSQVYVRRLEESGIAMSLVGPVEDVRPYYALMSALILPSLREGFPNVVLEAAAMGVPTITTTATGCRDSVLDGRTGRLVPPSDASALAVAISEMLRDVDGLADMGKHARDWVEKEFDPETIVGAWFHAPLGQTGALPHYAPSAS